MPNNCASVIPALATRVLACADSFCDGVISVAIAGNENIAEGLLILIRGILANTDLAAAGVPENIGRSSGLISGVPVLAVNMGLAGSVIGRAVVAYSGVSFRDQVAFGANSTVGLVATATGAVIGDVSSHG